MIVVHWSLFNGGINAARISEAKERAFEAAEISANTRRVSEREARVSWNAMIAAGTRLPLLREQFKNAKQIKARYSEQFEGGQRRLLDLLNIQAEVFLADSTLRTVDLVQAYNVYRVLAATGRLVAGLGLELPPEAVTPPKSTVLDGWHTTDHKD